MRIHFLELVLLTAGVGAGGQSGRSDAVTCEEQPTIGVPVELEEVCQDEEEECPFWAEEGECEANPRYMLPHCPKSCNSCGLCDRDKSSDKVLGDLDQLFARVIEQYDETKTHILSQDPWLVILDDFLSVDECKELLESPSLSFEPSKELNEGMTKLTSTYRTSETSFCIDDCDTSLVVSAVKHRAESLLGIPPEHFEFLQLVRYSEGQYYKSHHDSSPNYTQMPMGHRILTMFFYLDNVAEGGETSFPRLNLSVTPKAGRAVLWANVLREDPEVQDMRTEHEALPVKKGVKHGANFWIYQHDCKFITNVSCTTYKLNLTLKKNTRTKNQNKRSHAVGIWMHRVKRMTWVVGFRIHSG